MSNLRKLSASGLNTLLDDPKQYKKKYITFDEDKQRPSDTITLGSLIHCNLADENEAKSFKTINWELPSDKIQDIIWVYYQNTYSKVVSDQDKFDLTFDDDGSEGSRKLLDLCKAFGFNQHLKKDSGRLEHFKKNNADKYFSHLKMYKGKVSLITKENSDWAKEVSNRIKADPKSREIINFEQSAFETKLVTPYSEHFDIQGIIDNHWASADRNHLYLTDFKTSEMKLDDYLNKKLRSRYDQDVPNQIAHYDELLMRTIGEEEYRDIKVHRTVVYISQKTGVVYPFEISDETFAFWKNTWKSNMRKAEWHFANDSFNLPHDYQNYLVRV